MKHVLCQFNRNKKKGTDYHENDKKSYLEF